MKLNIGLRDVDAVRDVDTGEADPDGLANATGDLDIVDKLKVGACDVHAAGCLLLDIVEG